ncbi:FUSC family protein [Methyloligella solikamskensis]|uniref:Aromatic acid exporter family protein n=1 Tax=Methyloligella solikamskensis TaxID=1177756 RepID=A0ABW3J6P3_9HYPH
MAENSEQDSEAQKSLWIRIRDSLLSHLRSLRLTKEQALHAGRTGLQAAVAVAATFVAMRALGMPEKFVGLISAIFVLQPSVGNTLVTAIDRLLATIVGSVVGALCISLIPYGYGTAVSLAVTMFAINAIAGIRPDWQYGVVAGLAIALGGDGNTMETALDRFWAIALGGSIGVAVSLIVWPDTGNKRTRRKLSTALMACSELLDTMIAAVAGGKAEEVDHAMQNYSSAIGEARAAAEGVVLADSKPLENRIDQTEKLYTSILMLKRVTEANDSQAIADQPAMREAIDGFRCCAGDLVEQLAREETLTDDALDTLKDDLEKVRACAMNDSEERFEVLLDNALMFGLGEIVLSIENLKNAYDRNYRGSIIDWSADLASGRFRRPDLDPSKLNPLNGR